MFEDLLFDPCSVETELNRLYREDNNSSYAELRKRAARKVRRAIKSVLRGFRPRIKGYDP